MENKKRISLEEATIKALYDNLDEKEYENVTGLVDDVLVVTDPEISQDEYEELIDRAQELVAETPEGEIPMDEEMLGCYLLTCPTCGTSFINKEILQPGATCPVCMEVPESFIVKGRLATEDEVAAQHNVKTNNKDEEKISDNTDEFIPTDSDEKEAEETEETDEEDNKEKQTASKAISGNKLQESKNNKVKIMAYGKVYYEFDKDEYETMSEEDIQNLISDVADQASEEEGYTVEDDEVEIITEDKKVTEAVYSDGYTDDLSEEYPEEIRNKYYEYVADVDLDDEPLDFIEWVSEEYPDIYDEVENKEKKIESKEEKTESKVIATYKDGDSFAQIVDAENGKFINYYYDTDKEHWDSKAEFSSEEEARKMLKKHRPQMVEEDKEVKTESSNDYETERNPEAEETLRFEYKGISVSYSSETNVISFYDKKAEEDIDSIYYRNQTVEELKEYIDIELLPHLKNEVKTESKELQYVKNYNTTNGGYSNNVDTVYGELKDGTYFVYYTEMDQVEIYDCPVEELLEILYPEQELSEEEYQDEYNTFFENHNEDTLFSGPVYDEIHSLYFGEDEVDESKKITEAEDEEYQKYLEQECALAEEYKDRLTKQVTSKTTDNFNQLKDLLEDGSSKEAVDGFYYSSSAVTVLEATEKEYHLNGNMDLTISDILNMVIDCDTVEGVFDYLFDEYRADSAFSWGDNFIFVMNKLDFNALDEEDEEEFEDFYPDED